MRLYHSLGNPTIYRFPRSPLMTFMVPNPTSLLCLSIVILSLDTQYTPGFHLINICNTICLTFLTVYIATRTISPNPTSDVPQIRSPSLPSRTPPSPPSPHHCTLHPSVEGWCECSKGNRPRRGLTFNPQTTTRSSISRRRNLSKVRFPNDACL